MKQGYLISFEGGEGGGKSEQSTRLVTKLNQAGFSAIRLREPGGTEISEQIREVVLSNKNTRMTDRTEALLLQAARAQIYGEKVLPALESGQVVVMDRTRDSSIVYQGIVRGLGISLIERLNKISTQNTFPDLTLLLDVNPAVGLERVNGSRQKDRIESEDMDFHNQIRQAYLKLADKNDRARWFVIDAEQSIDQVSEEVWGVVAAKLTI